jgi:hypothetical protein
MLAQGCCEITRHAAEKRNVNVNRAATDAARTWLVASNHRPGPHACHGRRRIAIRLRGGSAGHNNRGGQSRGCHLSPAIYIDVAAGRGTIGAALLIVSGVVLHLDLLRPFLGGHTAGERQR